MKTFRQIVNIVVLALLTSLAISACVLAASPDDSTAVPIAVSTENTTDATYPVTEGETPAVAKDRAFFLAHQKGQELFSDSILDFKIVAEKNLTAAQCDIISQALTISAIITNSTRKNEDGNYYYFKTVNSLDANNLPAAISQSLNPQIQVVIRAFNSSIKNDFSEIEALRNQYTSSTNQLDRQNTRKKIIINENTFQALLRYYQSFSDYAVGDYVSGTSNASKAIELDKTVPEGFFLRALNKAASKDIVGAAADYGSAVALYPKYFDAYLNRARLYTDASDYDKAIADYTQCIIIKPDIADCYVQRGILYTKTQKSDLAFADFNRALAFDPKNYTALVYRSELLYQQKLYDMAATDYTALITIKPTESTFYLARGNAYYANNQTALAITDFQKATELGISDPALFLSMGNIYFDQKNYSASITAYSHYLESGKNDSAVYQKLGNCYDAQQDYEKAVVEYTNALAFSKTTQLYLLRADDYFLAAAKNKALYDSAIADCNAVLSSDAANSDALLLRGQAYKAQLNYDAAIADFTKIIDGNPSGVTAAQAYSFRAWCYAGKGGNSNNIHATQDFQKARIVEPTNPDYDYNLAEFYYTIRRAKSDTINAYKSFIKKSGNTASYADKVIQAQKRIIELGGTY